MKKRYGHIQFIGLGPQRTASTWLDEVLRKHPDVQLPSGVKETMFFDLRHQKSFSWYFSHFDNDARIKGEVAPTYFHNQSALRRLKQHNPDLKLVINIRNPIQRSFSLFSHHRAKGRVGDDFFEAIKTLPEIVETGKYSEYCPMWESAFPPDSVLYLVQEDIHESPEDVFCKICDHLKINQIPMPEIARSSVNNRSAPRSRIVALCVSKLATSLRAGRYHRIANLGKSIGLKQLFFQGGDLVQMNKEIFQFLRRHHEEDIYYLEQRLERDFSSWRCSSKQLQNV